jgi:oligoendopeptidase F
MSIDRALVKRSDVSEKDTWDLKPLFPSDAAWERAFKDIEKRIKGYAKFKGKLGGSAKVLRACLEFDSATERAMDRLAVYASLKMCEDLTNSKYVAGEARVTNLASRAMQVSSYIAPEILALPQKKLDQYLKSKELEPYRFNLEKLVRQKPHVLSEKEEKLLALNAEASMATSNIFEQLENSDLKFGKISDADGRETELTNESFRPFLESPSRAVREKAFRQYYAEFEAHKHTLAATLAGSVHNDVFHARSRGYKSCLDSALFADNVPRAVYSNLIKTVRANLPVVHRYYDLRRRALKLPDIHHYDTYVPILSDLKARHTFDAAVALILEALKPLGPEYLKVLEKGFASRWVDRYENKGKRSGAFSSGMYDSPPYMLMNFKEDVLDDVFTLAHEGGHSMHSYLSAKAQPYHTSGYKIFVAEVASTFNEQLLSDHMVGRATDDRLRAYLINREVDAIRSTLVRQTMFADFEMVIHDLAEAGEALTIDRLRAEYRKLLEIYFGPDFALDTELELECLRIPHFYRAFYVYKYATGISAAIALASRVTKGGAKELSAYLGFLKAGGSKWPLDILKDAGVDMSKPAPIQTAMKRLESRVGELEELLGVR